MTSLLIFAIALFIAVLVSELANRSILSTAVLFLAAGFVSGNGILNLIVLEPEDPLVQRLAEFALFSVLLTDGMRVPLGNLRAGWRLPGRALLIGMPLTLIGTAVICHYIIGLAWIESLLIGAVLSPTDPVFAAAIVGREEIPGRLRHMLNVESGLNDGLALPLVLIFLALASHESPDALALATELGSGIGIGIVLPWVACKIEQSRLFGISKPYEPLFAVAIGLLVLSVAMMTHANLYLAGFSAGVTVATVRPELRDEFHQFGELITELLKLAALLIFGAVMSFEFIRGIPPIDFVAAIVILVAVRPLALEVALFRSGLNRREKLTAGWFGPKGFASAIYGLLVFHHNIPNAEAIFHAVAVVVVLSIVAHSSTDVPLARWFRRQELNETRKDSQAGNG
jgi:NhaP-type Na+/H+ or K+/H+ antiporter